MNFARDPKQYVAQAFRPAIAALKRCATLYTLQLLLAALVIWRLKRFYADAPVDDLQWILDPTTRLVATVTGARFEWEPGQGYLSRERLFVIAKVCAGINFMIAAFGMSVWMLARRAVSFASLLVVLLVSFVAAYACAIVVNAARISFAVLFAAHPASAPGLTAAQIHRVEGIAFYFGGLLLLYALLRRFEPGASFATPLAWYFAITIAVPIANGAAGDSSFLEHALFVAGIPLALIACARLLTHRVHHFFMVRLSSR